MTLQIQNFFSGFGGQEFGNKPPGLIFVVVLMLIDCCYLDDCTRIDGRHRSLLARIAMIEALSIG